MGLDMYLNKKTVNGNSEEVIYWRKANQIFAWFETHCAPVENCNPVSVSEDNLIELLDTINRVLAVPEKASELLPVTQGFFFGSYEYNEHYFGQLRYTKEQLEKVFSDIADSNPNNLNESEFEFVAWW